MAASRKSKESKGSARALPKADPLAKGDVAKRKAPFILHPSSFILEYAVCAGLVVMTAAVYWQVYDFEYQILDDGLYVTENTHVQQGITLDNLAWAFQNDEAANWHPLTWISHELDCAIFGINPGPQHLVNVLFHIANTILLFLILRGMTRDLWPSAFVAALFALHPLHVESVAWIAERKDVLSTLFWLATMAAYLGYVKRPGVGRYLLVALAFGLGLMAKPMLVTLPFVLLLLDYWPLGRFTTAPSSNKKAPPPRYVWLLLDKAPLLAMAAASSLVTVVFQRRLGAVQTVEAIPLANRMANAAVSYVLYIEKMLWPSHLAAFYPNEALALPWWKVVGALFVLAGITVAAVVLVRRRPYLGVGWFWYLGTLVPVIGIVQVGEQGLADRYTYVPLIGLFIMAAWGLPEIAPVWRYRRLAFGTAAGAVLAALAVLAGIHLSYWRNGEQLFAHAIEVTSNNARAEAFLGSAFRAEGRLDEAVEHLSEALRLDPRDSRAHGDLGLILYQQGKYDEAVEHLTEAIAGSPVGASHIPLETNLGVALEALGKYEEAGEHYSMALQIDPKLVTAKFNLGNVMFRMRKWEQAIALYREVLSADPDHAGAQAALNSALAAAPEAASPPPADTTPRSADEYYARGNALAQQGQYREAADEYAQAVRIKPDYLDARINLGNALAAQHKFREAAESFREVLKTRPGLADVHINLGNVLAELGKLDDAVSEYEQALKQAPNNFNACLNLAKTNSCQGRLKSAREMCLKALDINPSSVEAQETLKNIEASIKKR